MLKNTLLLFFFIYSFNLMGCNNAAKKTDAAKSESMMSRIPMDTIPTATEQDSSTKAYYEQLRIYKEARAKIVNVQAELDKNIPKISSDFFKRSFYKHFKGKIGDKSAVLDLTISENGQIQGALAYDNSIERAEIWMQGGEDSGIIALRIPEATMLVERAYPISSLRGSLDVNSGIFKGYALNDTTLKPIPLEFKENYDGGALQMGYSYCAEERKFNKIPVNFSLGRHFASPSVSSDISGFLKTQLLRDFKDKNDAYYPSEDFDSKKFRQGLPVFMDFDSACSYLKNVHFEHWRKTLTEEIADDLMNEDGSFRLKSRLPMLSNSSRIIFNNGKLMVFELETWSMDGESYGSMKSTIVEYDLEQKKEISEKDVFKPDYDPVVMYKAMDKCFNFDHAGGLVSQFYGYDRYRFSYFTDKAIVFCGPGNHGWMYNRYTLPLEDLKPILSKAFLARYYNGK
jgi:hypothetical protein